MWVFSHSSAGWESRRGFTGSCARLPRDATEGWAPVRHSAGKGSLLDWPGWCLDAVPWDGGTEASASFWLLAGDCPPFERPPSVPCQGGLPTWLLISSRSPGGKKKSLQSKVYIMKLNHGIMFYPHDLCPCLLIRSEFRVLPTLTARRLRKGMSSRRQGLCGRTLLSAGHSHLELVFICEVRIYFAFVF